MMELIFARPCPASESPSGTVARTSALSSDLLRQVWSSLPLAPLFPGLRALPFSPEFARCCVGCS